MQYGIVLFRYIKLSEENIVSILKVDANITSETLLTFRSGYPALGNFYIFNQWICIFAIKYTSQYTIRNITLRNYVIRIIILAINMMISAAQTHIPQEANIEWHFPFALKKFILPKTFSILFFFL